jgi:glycerol uptake facilitator-like aquaporin
MDCETKMNTNGRFRPEEPNVATSFSGLAHDVVELAELQAQLLALDVKNTGRNARAAFVLTVVGASFLLSAISVGLFALAAVLVERLEWSQSAADIVAAVIGVALGGAVLAAAWHLWQSGLSALERSRDELSRNIAWIKSSLRKRAETTTDTERSTAGVPPNPR